ncbi:MAG: UspA domain protein [Deltaproteobacteria bacterium]|nr:UspA domain protein [Deltaproteobacteria bacterium]
MVAYSNILYCTDFSTSAKAALPFAIDMAKKYGASLHMVHVYQEPDHIAEFELSSDIHMDWVRVAQSVGTEAEKRLTALCEEVRKELPSCGFEMLRGKPHVEIMRYVKEHNVDLVVIASHGLSGLEHILFGSTAERIMRECPCNVLVIKKAV